MNQSQKRIVTVSLPEKGFELVANIELQQDSPYKLVESIRDRWKQNLKKSQSFFGDYEIGEVLPIHNISGIRDQSQISQMQAGIKTGQEILEKDHLPNIKLVVVPNRKLLIFDGHHSLLSYFEAGKKSLSEVPYIVVSSDGYKEITPEEISLFFPEETGSKVVEDWEKYVVNWQAKTGEQLELRNTSSIEELAPQLRKGNKGTVKQ